MNRSLLARTLFDVATYPERQESFDSLERWEQDQWRIRADRFVEVMQAHNYAFLKFLPNQGGKLG